MHNGVHPTIRYFYVAHAICCTIVRIIFNKTLIQKYKDIETSLDIIGHCALLAAPVGKICKKKWILLVVNFTFILVGTVSPEVGWNFFPSWEWTPTLLFKSLVSHARYTFLLTPANLTLGVNISESDEVYWHHVFLASVGFLMTISTEIQGFFILIAYGLSAATIWIAVTNFKQKVQQGFYRSIQEVKMGYRDLSRLADSINNVWHAISLARIVDAILWLATDLDACFKTTDFFVKLHVLYWFFYISVASILSSEACRMVINFLLGSDKKVIIVM